MVKSSYKSAIEKVEAGVITQQELDKMVEVGLVSTPRNGGGVSVNPMNVPYKGKTYQVIPTLYFKGGSKIVPNSKDMISLRTEVHKVINKYTSKDSSVAKS